MTGDTCSPGQDFEEAACTGPTCGMLILCYLKCNSTMLCKCLKIIQSLPEKTMK